jgi:threonine--tRNA ligase
MVQDKDQLLYIEQYFGSIDRFMAYIIEEYKGRFPLWLSPTQVKILPISDEQLEYAKTIEKELLKNKIRVKVDSRAEKIGYKIREAELERVPYMLILGKKEVEEKVLSIRRRGNKENEVMDLERFVTKLLKEIEEKEIF